MASIDFFTVPTARFQDRIFSSKKAHDFIGAKAQRAVTE